MTFDNEVIDKVWNKARNIDGTDPNKWKQDACSTPMKKDDYGNRDSQYGWEIDHKVPNGNDDLSNLQPLQWENNSSKGDGDLKCKCNKD
ncbi:MAG: HNH endonuclease [Nitrosopumilus sp.]|nr:HNH endonuclease [Nitrosopumilus sp.]